MSAYEQKYRNLLGGHDWFYDYTDDHSVWVSGKNQREILYEMRKQLDPDGAIWNEYAPSDFKYKK